MAIHEHSTFSALPDLFGRIDHEQTEWGFAAIKRTYLRAMTNEAFMLALSPILQSADEAHIVYSGTDAIFTAWRGKKRIIYKLLRTLASTALMRPGLNVEAGILVAYVDPAQHMDHIKDLFDQCAAGRNIHTDDFGFEDVAEETEVDAHGSASLLVSPEQVDLYQEAVAQKPYRRQLHILVVEDQVFSQKLLCEILRGVRVHNNNESPCIDAVQGLRDAWKIFVKKAPDVVFVDLNLVDGSGHTLARAMKELDPQAQVIIVTANNFEEELHVARQNNVDGFITKPYNKKQILDGIGRYIETAKPMKGQRRGSSGQF